LSASKYSAEVFLGKNKDGADPAVGKTGGGVTFLGDSEDVQLDRFPEQPTAKNWFNTQVMSFNNMRCDDDAFGNLTGASILVPKVAITQVTFDNGMLRFTTDNMTVNLTWHKWFDAIDSLRPSVSRIIRDARLVQELEVVVPVCPYVHHLAAGSTGNFSGYTNQPLFHQLLAATTEVLTMRPLPPRVVLLDAEVHLDKAFGSVLLSLVDGNPRLGELEFIKNIPHLEGCAPSWKHGCPSGYLVQESLLYWIREAIKGALMPLDHPYRLQDVKYSSPLKSLLYNVLPSGGQQVIQQLSKVSSSVPFLLLWCFS